MAFFFCRDVSEQNKASPPSLSTPAASVPAPPPPLPPHAFIRRSRICFFIGADGASEPPRRRLTFPKKSRRVVRLAPLGATAAAPLSKATGDHNTQSQPTCSEFLKGEKKKKLCSNRAAIYCPEIAETPDL